MLRDRSLGLSRSWSLAWGLMLGAVPAGACTSKSSPAPEPESSAPSKAETTRPPKTPQKATPETTAKTDPAKPSGAGEVDSAKPASRLPIEVLAADGKQRTLQLAPSDEGYTIADGKGVVRGRIVVKADHTKIFDESGKELAKVKTKENGFKIYRGDAVVMKAKKDGAGYKLKSADGAELGSTRGNTANVPAQPGEAGGEAAKSLLVWAKANAQTGLLEIQRGDKVIASLHGNISYKAAVFMGLTEELDEMQRLAAFIHLVEASNRAK